MAIALHSEYLEISFRLVAALAAGGIIGLERSFRGRAAGFRTHALVCIASSLLMLVTVYEHQWFVAQSGSRVVIDPTRMAQGIMTGIGFLGAGVIVKEGLTVRGLTTAASIWITSAIGILTGIGFYFAAGLGVVLTLGTLSVFRWIEGKMPTELYANFTVRFARDAVMPEALLRDLVRQHGFSVANLNYRLIGETGQFEYRMVMRTLKTDNVRRLSETLNADRAVAEYRISPASD
ncbi:MAG TPA: MgtC/SapB family protein [Burkholderiales bacterium]|nr:MgtC/SapB family protein [Burkholderiales bacterium]